MSTLIKVLGWLSLLSFALLGVWTAAVYAVAGWACRRRGREFDAIVADFDEVDR